MTIRSEISGDVEAVRGRCRTFGIFLFSVAVLFFFIAIPVSAEEFPVIETGYTYVDGVKCNSFTYPSDSQISHAGLSDGKIAYNKDSVIYIWDSVTGETKTFDTTELAERKDNWITFWMEIRCLDISNGVAYYSLNLHTTTNTGTSGSPKGLFSFDGVNNKNIISRHLIDDLLADNNLVLEKDYSLYDEESIIDFMRLRIYSHDSGQVITIDNRTEISDPMGFGEHKVAILANGISIPLKSDARLPGDGIEVFDLEPALGGGTVGQIVIPGATDLSSNEKVDVNQDCFSERYFVWMKGVKTVSGGEDQYQCKLYATDLNTLENTVLATRDDASFWLYAYAVDGDYAVYKNDGKIFLYHIPDGEEKEIRITGNEEFEVGDIVEFDEGQLLVRAYPKDYPGYEPSEYEIWFVDLNPFINPVEAGETGIATTGSTEPGKTETPLSPVVSVFSLLTAAVVFAGLRGRK